MRFVRHVKKPGWGIGRAIAEDDVDLTVYFEATGPKKLRKAVAQLEDVPSDQVEEGDLLRHLKPDADGAYAAPPLTFDDMVGNFERWIGGGFDHPKYEADEREYKDKAAALATTLLGKVELNRLLEAGDYTTIFNAHKRVVNATNIVSRFEKARLGSVPPREHGAFARAFVASLHGDGPFAARFDALVDTFSRLDIANWPTCTHALFLLHPNEHLVVKPSFVTRAADALGYELSYQSMPDAKTYARILEFAEYLRGKLRGRGLVPKDMIDVQSFIWYGVGGADENG